jgi:VCBS repeat-containing protein
MAIDIAGDAPLPGGLNPLATVAQPAAGDTDPDTDTASNGVSELPPPPSPPSSSAPAGPPGEGTVINVTFDLAGGDGAGAADDLGIDDLIATDNHAGGREQNDGQDPLDELSLDLTQLDLETLMGISIGGDETVADVAFDDGVSYSGGAKFGVFDPVSFATGSFTTGGGVQVTLVSFDGNDSGSDSAPPATDLSGFTDTTADADSGGGTDTDTNDSPITTAPPAPVNNTPVVADDGAATGEDTVLNVADAGVLANDTDPDGSDVLTVTAFDAVSAKGAMVHVNAGGGYIYNPTASAVLNALAAGETTDDSFAYTVSDGHGGAGKAKVKVTITGVNDAPVAAPDSTAGDEDTVLNLADAGVLANDTDPDGSDVLTVTAFDAVSAKGAMVHVNAGGGYIYNPTASVVLNALAAGETTDDSFAYTVSDGHGGAGKAKVNITITGANDAPVAADDAAATDVDTPLTIAVLANDTDVDGDGLSISGVTQGTNGAVTVNVDSSVTFTPEAGFTGSDSFTYSVSDGNSGGDTGTVTVTVASLIEGGPGDDTLKGTKGEDAIFGYGGDDTISGRGGNDTLYGDDGNDTVNGQGGSDALFGGAGDDILIWDSLDAVIDGGGGTDTLDARGADIDIAAFAGTITGLEIIDLSQPGADTVTLSAQDILDMSDSDTLTVTGGPPDTVEAGTGWTDAGFDGSGNHIYTQDVGATLATLLLDPDIAPNADIIA